MKVTILLTVCILSCGESKFESQFTGASSLALHSLIGTAARHEWQIQEPQDGVCSEEELTLHNYAVYCNPKYATGQRYVDVLLACNHFYGSEGSIIDARKCVESCGRNENGKFCYEFKVGQTTQILYHQTVQIERVILTINAQIHAVLLFKI